MPFWYLVPMLRDVQDIEHPTRPLQPWLGLYEAEKALAEGSEPKTPAMAELEEPDGTLREAALVELRFVEFKLIKAGASEINYFLWKFGTAAPVKEKRSRSQTSRLVPGTSDGVSGPSKPPPNWRRLTFRSGSVTVRFLQHARHQTAFETWLENLPNPLRVY